MKRKEKVVGICFAYGQTDDELPMVWEAGIGWLRMHVPFPWKNEMFGEIKEAYIAARRKIEIASAAGFKIMVVTPGLGSYRYDARRKATAWFDEWPAFAGKKGTNAFYGNVRKTCAWYAKDLRKFAGPLWQNMNEIDIPVFHGDYPLETAALTAFHSAAGIVSADPDALCGINLSRYAEDGLKAADLAYREGHSFGYIGDDQYFGSWQGRDVYAWNEVIDALYERYGLPVLANEWGYSSGGAVAAERPDPSVLPLGWPDTCYLKRWFHEVEGGHTPQVQADYIRAGLRIFAENPCVLGSFLFCWKDAVHCYHCGQMDCPSECYWGIMDSDCRPKPAYYAVKETVEKYY